MVFKHENISVRSCNDPLIENIGSMSVECRLTEVGDRDRQRSLTQMLATHALERGATHAFRYRARWIDPATVSPPVGDDIVSVYEVMCDLYRSR